MRLGHRHVGSVNLGRSLRPCSKLVFSCTRAFTLSLPRRRFEPRPQSNPQAKSIAVLGGGITGLASAYHLARTIPNAQVTLYEKSNRLGGWLDSEVVDTGEGDVVFEWGPRTLRSDLNGAGEATASLIAQLDMLEDVIGIPINSLAATNRFIYYPDHLVRMPGPYPGSNWLGSGIRNIYTLWNEPIFDGLLGAIIQEMSVKRRSQSVEDESVGDFVTRRFGSVIAENLLSAFFHGIYAGDIYNLSARTLLPMLWYLESKAPEEIGITGVMANRLFWGHRVRSQKDIDFHNHMLAVKDVSSEKLAHVRGFLGLASVYTFKKGLRQLASRLEDALRNLPNVSLKTAHSVQGLKPSTRREGLVVTVRSPDSLEYVEIKHDYAVCTLSPLMVSDVLVEPQIETSYAKTEILKAAKKACIESRDDWVQVMVVNLYYSNPSLIPVEYRGFGYLIPRSISIDQNPERALGVIFSSETSGVRTAPMRAVPRNLSNDEIAKIRQSFRRQTEDAKHGRMIRSANISKDPVTQADANLDPTEQALADQVTQDSEAYTTRSQDSAPGTKLTVMLGGHWWSSWSSDDIPTPSEAIDMAKAVLARHLGIIEQPLIAKARLAENAIPQYRPGYRQKMAIVHFGLRELFDGRLKLAGTPWQGAVGVNDCVRKAREVALAIREGWDDKTGLEGFADDEKWVLTDKKTGKSRVDTAWGKEL